MKTSVNRFFPKKSSYPQSLLISGSVWYVRFARKMPEGELGLCDPSTQTITIRQGQSPKETFMTFFHEVLHAYEFELDFAISHPAIEKLELALCDFFMENHSIFKNS